MAWRIGSLLPTRTSAATSPINVASVAVATGESVFVVMLTVVGATNRAGGSLTYGGVNLTQANSTQKAASSPEASTELWYLLNPTVGSATLSIPNTGSLTVFYQVARGISPPGTTVKFVNANGANNTSANPATGTIVLPETDNIVFACVASGANTFAPSARTGTLIQETDNGLFGGGSQYLLQPTTVAAGQNMTWTQGSDDWGAVSAAFSHTPTMRFNNYLFVDAPSTNAGVVSVGERIR